MNDIGRHVPSPAFRAALELEIVQELRQGQALPDPPSMRPRRRDRLRTVALLVIGLFLGVGTQLASAQVQEARQRTELESAKEAERRSVALRVQLAKQAEEVARKSFEAGAISRQALLSASADVRAVEIAYARLSLDLAELTVTAAPPRDELWAPLVASRDFVKERLQMEGMVAQQRLRDAEMESAEVDRAFSAGVTGRAEVSDARLDVAEAKLAFDRIVTRINLREQALKEGLAPEEVTRRLERMDTMLEIQHLQARLSFAEARLQRARERVDTGLATRAEGLRAELEVLEVQEQIQRLRLRLAGAARP